MSFIITKTRGAAAPTRWIGQCSKARVAQTLLRPSVNIFRAGISSTSSSSRAAAAAEAQAQPLEKTSVSTVSSGGIPFPGIPKIEDPYENRRWQLEHMAGAFRVFARHGFTEGAAGHISIRDPVDPTTFWINPLGKHFGLLKASDMVHINEEGQVIGGNRVAVNAAGFMIHSAIHRARPDINAACHTHSKYGKAWSTFGKPLELLNQDSCMLYNNQSVYSSFGGVALGADEGARIAEALGDTNRCIILQNHGLLTAGSTVDEAAYLYTMMERTCEIQLLAEAAGLEKKLVEESHARYTYNVTGNPEILYLEFQSDFEYEVAQSNGELNGGVPGK